MALKIYRLLHLLILLFCYGACAQSTVHPSLTQTSSIEDPTVITATFAIQTFAVGLTDTTSLPGATGPTATVTYVAPIEATDVAIAEGFVINNFSGGYHYLAACWYPVSGSYALLPRILFYTALVFALVARVHEWLIAGALTAALTYSGVAAIHACLLIWRGPGLGELDLFALEGILSTACIIAVPLLNWSSTLRHLGQTRLDPWDSTQTRRFPSSLDADWARSKKKREVSNTRTVIVWWAFLVAVGFLATFVGFENTVYEGPLPIELSSLTFSAMEQLLCVPPNGFLNQSEGQMPGWEAFWITTEFLDANNCVEPCSTPLGDGFGTIFRSSTDLQSLNMVEVNRNFEGVGLTSKETKANRFSSFYEIYALYSVPYIIAQGVWAVLFNRRSPAEARNIFFRILSQIPLSRRRVNEKGLIGGPYIPGKLQLRFAWFCATIAYLWALFIFVICPPIFVLNIISTEILLHTLPQSETNTHIGQWQPWAATVLVLIAAMIAQFHEDVKKLLKGILNSVFWKIGHFWKHRKDFYETGNDSEEDDLYGKPRASARRRPDMQRKISVNPDQRLILDTRHAVEDILLDVWDEFIWYLRDGKNIFTHEWLLFAAWWRVPFMRPWKRMRPERAEGRRILRRKQHLQGLRASFYNNIPLERPVYNEVTIPLDLAKDTYEYLERDEPEDQERSHLHPEYLPGGERVISMIESFGLGEGTSQSGPRQVPLGHAKSAPAPRAARSVAFAHAHREAERKRRSQAALPPLPSGATTPEQREEEHGSPEIIEPGESTFLIDSPTSKVLDEREESPTATTTQANELSAAHPALRDPRNVENNEDQPQQHHTTVVASLSDSMAHRPRRSQLYSPELSPLAQQSHQQQPIAAFPPPTSQPQTEPLHTQFHVPPPPPVLSTPITPAPVHARLPAQRPLTSDLIPVHTEFPSQLPPIMPLSDNSARSSHLISEAEFAALFAHGTSSLVSTATSPEQSARNTVFANSGRAGGAGDGDRAAKSVSYLQVQAPPTAELGEEVTLRLDRYGQWAVVGRNGDVVGSAAGVARKGGEEGGADYALSTPQIEEKEAVTQLAGEGVSRGGVKRKAVGAGRRTPSRDERVQASQASPEQGEKALDQGW